MAGRGWKGHVAVAVDLRGGEKGGEANCVGSNSLHGLNVVIGFWGFEALC